MGTSHVNREKSYATLKHLHISSGEIQQKRLSMENRDWQNGFTTRTHVEENSGLVLVKQQ